MSTTKRLRNVKNIDSSKDNKRYLKRSEKGVSEVLGTILTLGITVVLFTSVFAAVNNLPEAEASPHVDFDAEIDVEDELLSITHLGGGTLPAEATSVFIVVDTTSYNYPLDSEEVFIENDEERWRINEKIMIDISEVEITTREIEILIIDQNTRKVLWNSYVTSPAIPRAIVINDLWVNYRRDWEDFANAGEEATLYAEVIPGIDTEIRVLIDLSGLEGYEDNGAWQTNFHNMTHERGNRYSLELQTSSLQPDGNYRLRVEAHTHAQHLNITREFVENGNRNQTAEWTTSRLSLNIGPPRDLRERPDIRIDSGSIRFSPGSPISGDLLTTHAIVKNHGGSSAEVEVEFINRDPTGAKILFGFITVNVASGGERDISARTEIFSSGEHVMEVNAVNVTSDGGEDLPPESKRYASTTLNVQPTILIVADDHEFGGDSDLMIGALEGADYQFDVHRVTRGDGPPSSVLNRYDVIIWLTGRTMGKQTGDPVEEQPTLTSNDRANIQEFLTDGGNLWLIGEGIYEDSSNWGTFLGDNFGINSLDSDSTAPDSDLYGKSILSNTTYILREDVENRGNHIYPGDATCMLEDGMESGDCIAVNFTGVRNGNSFRTAFNSFRFSSMRRGHTSMAANVIQWLGNVTHRESRDVAVTDQDFSTHVPQYKDVVAVTGSVRNNGPIDETVEVRLFINDRIDRTQRISLRLASGEEKDVRFNWTAEPVGIHELKIVVDPYNEIPERNVRNNDITYKDVDVTINVQFSILLVDHDVSASSPVIESLERLGYEYRLVSKDEELTEDLINRFNAVYWIAGDSEDSIGEEESELLMDYLDNNEGVSLFLQGNTVLTNMTQTGSVDHQLFFQNYLGIGSSIDRTSLPTDLEGVTQDPVSHGMRFEMVEKDLDLDVVQPTHGAEIVLHHQVPLAVRFDGGNFKTLFMGPGLDHVEGPNIEHRSYHDFHCDIDVSSEAANQQLIYTLTKWFGNVDERIELRIADEDITIPENPMLGRSYQIRALIENIGFKESNALIRFKDNDSLIASESIYVPPNGFSDAEVNWRPVFAGHGEHERKIRVLVDPICAVEEIGINQMGFNNLGVRTTPVYYFYDDMESGSEKWSHETVLANIDGEGPIDYLGEDYEKVYTDIISEWDEERSHGIELIDEFSRSDPHSYMLSEPIDTESRVPLDMGLMIDTTGSMNAEAPDGRTWMDHAIEATQNMIELFDERDRVALFELDHHAKDDGTFLYEDFRYMTEENKVYFKERVAEFEADGGTPLWDASGYTISHIIDNPREYGEPDEDYVQSVVLFTDGDDEHYSGGYYERGSNEYAPGSMPGYGLEDHTWGVTEGHEWDDGFHSYANQGGLYNDVLRYGQEGSTSVDWIGLWYRSTAERSTERKALVNSPVLAFTVGLGTTPQSTRPEAPGYMPPDDSRFPFTSEYQLIQIAESTGGSYYYAPEADELIDIFEEIFKQAIREAHPGNLTSLPNPITLRSNSEGFPIHGENYDKWAVTPIFDLSDYSSARLTFNQKYRMVRGMNGAYLQIGYRDENHAGEDGYAWRYVTPSKGSYTGNLNLSDHREDSFGNRIDWAWNGVSGGGSFSWDPVSLELLRYVPEDHRDDVRIRFDYKQYGSGTGFGWFIDDVQVKATRDEGSDIGEEMKDVWQLVTTTDSSGEETTAWWNGVYHDNSPSMKPGIDNSLVTSQIDLTRAKTAHLTAEFKFNINSDSGAPPDGFRVEVSRDNGISWSPINLGARAASGVSGSATTNYWTTSGELNRLLTDISDFTGETILIRFRVITNNAGSYHNYEDESLDFRGIYMNNVTVEGKTVEQ